MNIVWVVATLRPGCKDPDEAAGVWQVCLDQSMEPEFAVGAALDVFHSKVAIRELEDFDISTLDPSSRAAIVESAAYQQGSGGAGRVKRIAAALPPIS